MLCSTIIDCALFVRLILRFFRSHVLIFVPEFQDVSIHSCPKCSFFIVSFQVNTSIFFDLPIFSNIVIFFQDCGQVICMLFPNIIYTEIIYNQTELDRSPFLYPWTRGSSGFVVYLFFQSQSELFFFQNSKLG